MAIDAKEIRRHYAVLVIVAIYSYCFSDIFKIAIDAIEIRHQDALSMSVAIYSQCFSDILKWR